MQAVRNSALPLLALLLASPAWAQTDLVPFGAVWSYLDDGSNQGTAWRAPSFDDSGWATGPAQLGYGDGDEATVVSFGSDPNQKHATTYFRHSFQVPDPTAIDGIELRLIRDDGAALYLNGTQLRRENLNPGTGSSGFASSAVSGADESREFISFIGTQSLVAGENVIAVEIHQSSASSTDISFDLRVIALTESVVLRGPYLQNQRSDATVVRWASSAAMVGAVWVGDSPQTLVQVASEQRPVFDHEIEVTGLRAGMRYFYGVGKSGSSAPPTVNATEFIIRTPPEPGAREPFRAWVLGDSGLAGTGQDAVRDAYLAHQPNRPTDLAIFLGDNAYGAGFDDQYQVSFFEPYDSVLSSTPSWSTRGNHEQEEDVYLNVFTHPTAGEAGGVASGTELYYSFDWSNVHFVCLDSFSSSRAVGGAMYTWLEADLASTSQDWIIAFWHHPPYSKGSHNSDTETALVEMREHFLPVLEDYGVSLVFGGHSHAYERSGLIDGHYGTAATWNAGANGVDLGDGRPLGSGAYEKLPTSHSGAVYVVAGSSSFVSPNGSLDHPAMVHVERELGSVILDVAGGRIDVAFLDDVGTRLDWFSIVDPSWDGRLCTGTIDGQGCSAVLSTAGVPSVSSAAPFTVTASGMRSQVFGFCFYSVSGGSSAVLPNGRLCMSQPLRRTTPSFSGGSAPCSGSLSFDLATVWSSFQAPELMPGETVFCQFWHRDEGIATSTLTEAITVTLVP